VLDWLTADEAADELDVDRAQLEALVAAGFLEVDADGRIAAEAVAALEQVLRGLEAGRLGLEGLDRPPPLVTAEQARAWLALDEGGLEELEDEGALERVPWHEVGDLEVVELLRAAEAADPAWSTEDALVLDSSWWLAEHLGRGLGPDLRADAAAIVGAEGGLYRTEDVRAVARRRGRFNPAGRRRRA